ncbi:hypothetical protein H8L32_05550 [Undibacterium sp. CY18W]|uniref:Uncharacterized protein n=1 Tax=Undibacterium hunanense TaxID=2762292 RepID=A0ABR6ZMX0_9BURK|nr:hypothetical protein [Undibacterium hunanense]MBC3916934.1 hypothetical protein [Undibacterium hunanense]
MKLNFGRKFICNHGNDEGNQHFILPANKIERKEIVYYRASKYDDRSTALIPLTIASKSGDKKWPQDININPESDKILYKNESGITAPVIYDKLVRHKLIFLLQKTYKVSHSNAVKQPLKTPVQALPELLVSVDTLTKFHFKTV